MLGWAALCACFIAEEEGGIERYSLCAHIYAVQFDISASYCVQRPAAAGGIFSCFIHELINGAQIALLSILTSTHPACVCLLRHRSLLAEGCRKQHKLSIQLYAPQKNLALYEDLCHFRIPFYPQAVSNFIPS